MAKVLPDCPICLEAVLSFRDLEILREADEAMTRELLSVQ